MPRRDTDQMVHELDGRAVRIQSNEAQQAASPREQIGDALTRPDLAARSLADLRQRIADLGVFADAEFTHEGIAWKLSLDSRQTHVLVGSFGTAGNFLALLAGPLWPAIAGPLNGALGYIELVNTLGGDNGVEIHGTIGGPTVYVTPRLSGFFALLAQIRDQELAGQAVIALLSRAAALSPQLAATLELPVVAAVLGQIASGTPLGVALATALGFGISLLGGEPDINEHGGVHADRSEAREWESFYIGPVPDGEHVALLSWQGYLSAQNGGGADVYANRPEIGPWETWSMIHNGDGTISLQSIGGHYLCAEEGGGRECWSNRTAIGAWEKFVLVPLAKGRFALRTLVKGTYVSVQSGK